MHILVLHRYSLSEIKGTNPSFPYFLEKLISRGHKVSLVTFSDKKNKISKGLEFYPIKFNFNRTNRLEKWLKSLLFIFVAPFKVKRLAVKYRFDMVYCDDSLPFYAYLTKIVTGLPTVMRLGDLQTAYFFYDCRVFGKIIYKILHLIEKFTWNKIDKIVAISKSFKHFLVSEGIPASKVSVVEESIDIRESYNNLSKQEPTYPESGQHLVMFHGLVTKIKGVDVLLKAAKNVLKEIPSVKFLIVGDGNDLSRLKKLSQKIGIESNVRFIGWVPLNKLPQYISVCDLGISSRNNNIGNNFVVTTALLQYWSLKKPVVLPGLQAVKDIVRGTKLEACLFEPGNPKDLSVKIKNLLIMSETERALIGELGFQLAERYFNAKSVAQKMVTILEEFYYEKH